MKLYLAGRYGRRIELLGYAAELNALGHDVTSRWIRGEHEAKDANPSRIEAEAWAIEDFEDIRNADAIVAFTEHSMSGYSRGGRHVELGYALAINYYGKDFKVYIVGPHENVFCYIHGIKQFDSFNIFKVFLEARPN